MTTRLEIFGSAAAEIERREDVAQEDLLHRLATHLVERARAQRAGLLLADRAVEAQHERGLVGDRRRPGLDQRDRDRDQDGEEDQVQDDAPAGIDEAPEGAEEPAHRAGIGR